uniref:Patatin like phospholipase domain containing 4 n=1 Tax=Callorhinchus milii TaxID=7868 RepID=A0A4W3GUB6_CALMI
MAGLNLTFSASGFLGIYHLGAASALLRHGRKLLGKVDNYTGASGGALVAAVLVSEPEKLEVQTPSHLFGEAEGMEGILSADAHQKAHLRLHVSITNIKTMKNYLVSSFATREDFITILLASSFVPFYAGVKPVEYKGETWIDGGLTNRLPILPTGQTITVSPFDGQLDICPEGDGRTRPSIRIAKQDFILSKANFVRVNHAFFPPSQEKMEILYQNGFDDAVRFLRSKSWLD